MRRAAWLLLLSTAVAGGAAAAPLGRTWSGELLGHDSLLTVVERDDGRLVGFLPADPNARLVGGEVDGKQVILELRVEDPGMSATGTFEGTISGKHLDGDLALGGPPVAVSLVRENRPHSVEYWLLGEDEIDSRALRLLDHKGDFASGGYVGLASCDFLSCAGDFTAWDVSGAEHAIAAEALGGCPLEASLDGLWSDVEKLLVGTWEASDCNGLASGDFVGGKSGLAESKDVVRVLTLLAELADRVEAESLSALDLISDGYLNDGKTKAHWESDLAELYGDYDDLVVEVARIDAIVTANDADVNPMVSLPPRVEWRLRVTGAPVGGGAVETVTDVEFGLEGSQQLFWIAPEQGVYRFVGNGYAEPFAIDLPISSLADSASSVYGLWPFGVHGGGHPEGHAGWDVEYVAGAPVVAAADGVVTEVEPNDGDPAQTDVTIEHRPWISTRYHHLTDLSPAVAVGAVVAAGDELGDPGSFPPGFLAAHFDLRIATDPVCPEGYLSPAAQALFDGIWAEAAWGEELTEPFPCQPLAAGFPLVRVWERTSGALAPRLVLSRATAATAVYGYELRDAADVVLETGTATLDLSTSPASIDLVPDGGGATHLGVYDVVSDELSIDWDDVARPVDLAGATTYRTD